MKGDEIVRRFDRHRNETATVRKHVTKYKHMRKLMLVFLGNFFLRIVALKFFELTQFASPNLSIYFNFVWCWGSVVMLTFLNEPAVRSPLIVKVYVLYFVKVLSVQF